MALCASACRTHSPASHCPAKSSADMVSQLMSNCQFRRRQRCGQAATPAATPEMTETTETTKSLLLSFCTLPWPPPRQTLKTTHIKIRFDYSSTPYMATLAPSLQPPRVLGLRHIPSRRTGPSWPMLPPFPLLPLFDHLFLSLFFCTLAMYGAIR